MDEAEQLSQTIGEIYDASLDPSRWVSALQKSCTYVGCSAARLFCHDAESEEASSYFQWGNDLLYEKLYLEKYVKLNPLFPAAAFIEVGVVQRLYEAIPAEEFFATRFYQEWVKPQGVVEAIAINLERSASRSAMLALMRFEAEGLFDEEAVRRVRLLIPHLRRAILIGNVIAFHRTTADVLTQALGRVGSAVFLVDAQARIVFSNDAARKMLEEGSVLRDEQGRLVAASSQAHAKRLSDAMIAAAGGDRVVGEKGIAIPLAEMRDGRWLAHVLPLTSGARQMAGAIHSATAAVFVRKNQLAVKTWLEAAATEYKLTPSEVRVLQAIVDLKGTPAVAEALGISRATVRTHLQRIFSKTGTNRQADLIKLATEIRSPLGG